MKTMLLIMFGIVFIISFQSLAVPVFAPSAINETNYWPPFTSKDHPYLSPLMQIKGGTLAENIHCNPNLVLVIKYDGSPACVNPETKEKLVKRGWTSFVTIQLDVGKFGTYELHDDNKTFQIKYLIKGGADIKEVTSDVATHSIKISLERNDSGTLELTLLPELIDVVLDKNTDKPFIVLIDGIEVPYTENADEVARTLIIPFEKNSNTIEIISTVPL